jgi:hypothetical protein
MEKVDAMKKTLLIFLILTASVAHAQNRLVEGTVSYVNNNSVYVRFENTKNLTTKDTLMVLINKRWVKSLVVQTVSSKSCITTSFVSNEILVGFKVGYYQRIDETNIEKIIKPSIVEIKKDSIPLSKTIAARVDTKAKKQSFNGRFSVSTNGSMNQAEKSFNRIRTAFALNINNINGGKFSFENYFIYSQRFGVEQTQRNFKNDFKIYSLSTTYDVNENTNLSIGRKINNRMANMGAIDGLHIEHKYKKLILGGFGGFRPDDLDYSFNASLLQFGAFVAHETEFGKGQSQTSLAFAEQKNNLRTDRRFIYLQHTNAIIKNLNLFYSIELDLFQNINGVKSNKINLTSTYISLRYKPFKKMNITASYDNRRNVIYYETYRTYIDQLLNQETRQGVRLNVNYNISKFVHFNASGFYRYQQSKPEPTKNYVVNLTFPQIPSINASLSLNVNAMQTYYFNGNIYGARLNKDLFKSRLSAELNYRKIDYTFFNTEQPSLKQDIVGFSANIYGKKRTSLMFSYEGTFEPNQNYNRYYITLSQRFRSKK